MGFRYLKGYNAKATFFCVGQNAEEHPTIVNRITDEGHSLGNHTHNHIKGWKYKTKDYLKNVEEASNIYTQHYFVHLMDKSHLNKEKN